MNRIVIVNGGYRTGSTWAYNVTCELLRHTPQGCAVKNFGPHMAYKALYQNPDMCRQLVMKVHNWIPPKDLPPHVFCVYTWRNPADVAQSLMRIGYNDWKTVVTVWDNIRTNNHIFTKQLPHIYIPYTGIHDSSRHTVRYLAKSLGLDLKDEVYDKIADKFTREKIQAHCSTLTKREAVTEWRPDHVAIAPDYTKPISPCLQQLLNDSSNIHLRSGQPKV